MGIVTTAKKSYTAFQKADSRNPGRGRPPKKGGCACHGNAYGTVLYCHRDTPEYFCLPAGEIFPETASLPENPFQEQNVKSRTHGLPAEIFFLFMEKQQELRITQIIQEQQDESGTYWGHGLLKQHKLFTHK